jgi:beta-galactosidase
VPTANLPVTFEVSGGRIIGLGNGDANSHEPEKGNARRLYNGLAQVIVQTEEGGSGALVLRARSDGLQSAEARIVVRPDPGPPSVSRTA